MSILITGAAHRIGRAMTLKFHAAGHNVLLHCNQSTTAAASLAEDLNTQRPDSAHVVTLDLAHLDGLDEFRAQCLQYTGRLDALINNAAAFYPTPLPEVSAEQFNELININLRAPYFLTKTFVDFLKGGSVVNIIDIYAEKPLRGFSAYSISKAGLAMMTRSLADELGPDIRVNGIAPGAILWPDAAVMDNKTIESILAGIPAGRLGDPNDIANAALFLVDQADYVSGQIISVAGGSSV